MYSVVPFTRLRAWGIAYVTQTRTLEQNTLKTDWATHSVRSTLVGR